MTFKTLSHIASRLMGHPAAPYHEHAVRAEVEIICQENGLPFDKDPFGNLFVRLQTAPKQRPLVLAAHLERKLTLRQQAAELDDLARALFEAQFDRAGGRRPADPAWDDLDENEREEWWEQARNAAHVIDRLPEAASLGSRCFQENHEVRIGQLKAERDHYKRLATARGAKQDELDFAAGS